MTPQEVVSVWQIAGESRWFSHDPAFDGELSVRFKVPLAAARAGAFDDRAETPDGALGLAILLDQFSRNIHRNSPLAFAADAKALALAKRSISRGDHYKMPATMARWFVMPFVHAEDLDAQRRGVALFTTMGFSNRAYWAQIHLDIIAKFGRFPHRNPILGRNSTPEESAFLAAGGFAG